MGERREEQRERDRDSQKEREMSGREEEEEMRGICGVLPFKGTRLSACAQRPFSRSEYLPAKQAGVTDSARSSRDGARCVWVLTITVVV